ncbi:hypothetical protein Tc00.1047053508071.40 [Trypanosoma cruzi]|uniref:Uncharacterized protein n=1 Tax=Trypanosoma cruzi (strain CL Brener) TaxID=353153 RepID=Q4D5G2_TRYCC|nr:hypothetical protein Tc00.1047053508071.40 [Trypanosoma cruzi]EAN87762.1 hypothetical protein Tc00.1047053508071.40 [Trypanosoma cruzi]|eukprot:XP_809613.1 hypothetical protein [Trypanosoma cruzi strain CL Brener]
MAAACGCRSLLSRDMPRRFPMCVASGTMCQRLCDCRMEGEVWRELRERRCQESRWASCRGGHCPPNAAPPCRAPSITPQHRSRRHQHTARQRMPPPPRVRPEGDTSAVAFRGVTSCGTAACPKPPRGLRTRHRAVDAECLRRGGHRGGIPPFLRVDGRLIFLSFLPMRVYFFFFSLRTLAVLGRGFGKPITFDGGPVLPFGFSPLPHCRFLNIL